MIDRREYERIHWWLRKNYGSADLCEGKQCSGKSKTYEWALKKGKKHEKKRSSYICLCRSCHNKYDWNKKKSKHICKISHTEEANKKRGAKLAGRKRPAHVIEAVRKYQSKPVIKITAQGQRIFYLSIREAADDNVCSVGAVWFILKGINRRNLDGDTYVYANDFIRKHCQREEK